LKVVCIGTVWDISGSCTPNECEVESLGNLIPNVDSVAVRSCNTITECQPNCNPGFYNDDLKAFCTGQVWYISGSCTPNDCEAHKLQDLIPNVDYKAVKSCNPNTECKPNCNPGFYNNNLKAVCIGPAWEISGSCTPNDCKAHELQDDIPNVDYMTVTNCDSTTECQPNCKSGFYSHNLKAVCIRSVWKISGSCTPNDCKAHELQEYIPNVDYMTVTNCDSTTECQPNCKSGFYSHNLKAVCIRSVWKISGSCTPNDCEAHELQKRIPNVDYMAVRSCDTKTECKPNCKLGFYNYDLKAICIGSAWEISGSCMPNVCNSYELLKLVQNIEYRAVRSCDTKTECEPNCEPGFSSNNLKAVCIRSVWEISGSCTPNDCETHELQKRIPNADYMAVRSCDTKTECQPNCKPGFSNDNLKAVCIGSFWEISGSCTPIPNDCEAHELQERIQNVDHMAVRSCETKTECQPNCKPGFFNDDLKAVCIGSVWDISGRCSVSVCFAPTEDEAEKQVPYVHYGTLHSCNRKSRCKLNCV